MPKAVDLLKPPSPLAIRPNTRFESISALHVNLLLYFSLKVKVLPHTSVKLCSSVEAPVWKRTATCTHGVGALTLRADLFQPSVLMICSSVPRMTFHRTS